MDSESSVEGYRLPPALPQQDQSGAAAITALGDAVPCTHPEQHGPQVEKADSSPELTQEMSESAIAAGLTDAENALKRLEINEAPPPRRPLQFMDLPVDVLEEVVKQVGASNDLISLALCNSWMHAIVMPHMYSRFDIVWPEPGEETDSRPGVDALAYGLGTLVMSGTIYGAHHAVYNQCSTCERSAEPGNVPARSQVQLVSNYAQFVRKFAIGNGPPASVAAYNYSTESGKMLGTLVALAIARMVNLEIFFWDMPTGIAKEVWQALSSLGYTRDKKQKQCNLSSVWVRCHDSKKQSPPSLISYLDSSVRTFTARQDTLRYSYAKTEGPNFSILPPLRKIGVVEIDEVAYFEELAQLIDKSQPRLRELRIGAARTRLVEAESDGPGYYNEPSTTCLGAGGVLGMLMSRVHDCRRLVVGTQKSLRRQEAISDLSGSSLSGAHATARPHSSGVNGAAGTSSAITPKAGESESVAPTNPGAQALNSTTTQKEGQENASRPTSGDSAGADEKKGRFRRSTTDTGADDATEERRLDLQVLELENITIASFVLRYSLNWSTLTELTLLNCALDEVFWGDLKTDFAPVPKLTARAGAKPTIETHDFPLKLRKVHVDGVSTSLIATLRDCLAPNTLECLFLQDRKDYAPSQKVTVDAIYKGPLRRHRASLQKLSIDSQFKHHNVRDSYEKWLLTRDVLAFVCSGKMPQLRELAVSVAYEDWHFLFTGLPNVPQLRSLYIPFIHDYPGSTYFNPREIALQVLDIVTLRPEMNICYIGIQTKCFEILEGKKAEQEAELAAAAAAAAGGGGDGGVVYSVWGDPLGEDLTDSDSEEEFFPPLGNDSTEERAEERTGATEGDRGHESEPESDTSSEAGDSRAQKPPKLRLRDILFYTEKVEIFKVERGTIFFTT